MSWKDDSDYRQKLADSQTKIQLEESLRQVRTNIAQILDGLLEIEPRLENNKIDNVFLTKFNEWFWKRSQKAKSAGTEKTIAYMNRIRRYIRIAIQLKTDSNQIKIDFADLISFFQELLRIFDNPEGISKGDDISYLERIQILEEILFPRIGMKSGNGPDACLVHLSKFPELTSCLRVLLTPTIPPTIPKNIDRKLFGLSEKVSNIFAGITLNFVTDSKFFDVSVKTDDIEEKWKIPGISYAKVMEPYLSDFGVNEKDFFKALCSHIGLQIAESKKEEEKYFILNPTFVKVFHRIGYLQKRVQNSDKSIIWYPQISEETLYLQYLALVATNRGSVQPDLCFWISITFAYFLYKLMSKEFIKDNNVFRGVVMDDLVRVSIVPYSVKTIALQLGGLEWSKKMPVELETRKDILSGLLKISNCNFTSLKAKFDERVDQLFNDYEDEEEINTEALLSDSKYWKR